MDPSDIRAIVDIWVGDYGITPNVETRQRLHQTAIDYYHQYGEIISENELMSAFLRQTEQLVRNTLFSSIERDLSSSSNVDVIPNNEAVNVPEEILINEEPNNEESSDDEIAEDDTFTDNDDDINNFINNTNVPPLVAYAATVSPLIEYTINDLISRRQLMSWNQDQSQPNDQTDVKLILPINEIDKLKLFCLGDENNIESNKECLICYDPFIKTELIRVLPCGHNFHRLCIDNQLNTESHLCPFCRQSTGRYVRSNM